MIFSTGTLKLPNGFVAELHAISSIKFILDEELLALTILSWGDETAYLKGFPPTEQIASIPFNDVPNSKGVLTSILQSVYNSSGPLPNVTPISNPAMSK